VAATSISACVVCYNNEATLGGTIQSIQRQTMDIDELLVVDDGSTDGSAAVAAGLGARVISHPRNLGRGAARARSMTEARHDLVLCVDATGTLDPGFLSLVLPWFADASVAAVCSRIDDPRPEGLVRRWRARHLFRTGARAAVTRRASLITGGSVLRRATILDVGNFDSTLRYAEDADVGRRLLARGYDVVFDPRVCMTSTSGNSLGQVLERYSRWSAASGESLSWNGYLRQVAYSIKVMARQDLSAHDPAAVAISLLTPHYQAWRTLRHRTARSAGSP
jgi:glycosyltransferase involved in cell wall biosynthesis